MPRLISSSQSDMDQSFWDSQHEYRKVQSAKDRCKERKYSTIQQGINDYFDRSGIRKNKPGSYDEWDNFDDRPQY